MQYVHVCTLVLLATFAVLSVHEPLWLVYLLASMLEVSLLFNRVSKSLLVVFGLVATACMLICFGAFFSFVHEHPAGWYSATETRQAWINLLAGLAIVQVIAGFSCRLKENASFDSPNGWVNSILNSRRRIQESHSSS